MGAPGGPNAYLMSGIFILLPITVIIFYFYCHYKLSYWRRRGVPQFDDSDLIFGDLKDGILMRKSPGAHLGELYHRAPPNVPYFGFYIFHKPCLIIKDPEIIKDIMIRDFENFTDRLFAGPAQRDSIGMLNLFGVRNPAWRYMVKKISPTLSLSKLKQTLPFMLEPSGPMLNYLEEHNVNNNNETQDAQDISFKFAADIFSNVALGTKTDSFYNPGNEYTKNMMGYFYSMKRMVSLVILFFVPELAKIFGESIFYGFAFLRKMFWSAVEQREKSGVLRGDYIDTLIKLKNGEQNPVYKFEGDNLLSQAGTFLGFESSSFAAGFTLQELAQHPEYQERVRHEVQDAVARNGWTIEAFNEMKYLDMCLAEALRMYPPISIIDRETINKYEMPNSDHIIEHGISMFFPLYGLHYDSRYFEDPKTFNPERFAPGNKLPTVYMPYGYGPRKCTAPKFGQLHVKIMVAKILSEFELRQPLAGHSELDQYSTLSRAANGVNLTFTKLKQ